MLKVGDNLICHSNDYVSLTINKIYPIIEIKLINNKLSLIIENNIGSNIAFTIYEDEFGLSYKNWFNSLKEIRKQKLNEICLSQEIN